MLCGEPHSLTHSQQSTSNLVYSERGQCHSFWVPGGIVHYDDKWFFSTAGDGSPIFTATLVKSLSITTKDCNGALWTSHAFFNPLAGNTGLEDGYVCIHVRPEKNLHHSGLGLSNFKWSSKGISCAIFNKCPLNWLLDRWWVDIFSLSNLSFCQ